MLRWETLHETSNCVCGVHEAENGVVQNFDEMRKSCLGSRQGRLIIELLIDRIVDGLGSRANERKLSVARLSQLTLSSCCWTTLDTFAPGHFLLPLGDVVKVV